MLFPSLLDNCWTITEKVANTKIFHNKGSVSDLFLDFSRKRIFEKCPIFSVQFVIFGSSIARFTESLKYREHFAIRIFITR